MLGFWSLWILLSLDRAGLLAPFVIEELIALKIIDLYIINKQSYPLCAHKWKIDGTTNWQLRFQFIFLFVEEPQQQTNHHEAIIVGYFGVYELSSRYSG